MIPAGGRQGGKYPQTASPSIACHKNSKFSANTWKRQQERKKNNGKDERVREFAGRYLWKLEGQEETDKWRGRCEKAARNTSVNG